MSMATITISKNEYSELVESKMRYESLRMIIAEDVFASPPTKNTKEILGAFESVGKYGKLFVNSLKKGLKRSAHFK